MSNPTTQPALRRPSMLSRAAVVLVAGAGFGLAGAPACAHESRPAAGAAIAIQPEVFSIAGYEADRAAAKEAGKLHLVYATATWCGPCQRMKKTTWVDESVTEWMEANAIVTALDVDEFRSTSRSLGVRAMPTMILFDGDDEIGRTVGFKSAEGLLQWADSSAGPRAADAPAAADPAETTGEDPAADSGGAETGANTAAEGEPTFEETMRERASELTIPVDIDLELEELRRICEQGRHESACDAYMWLWNASMRIRRGDAPLILDAVTADMAELADRHPASMERMAEERDAIRARMEDGEPGLIVHWATLARATAQTGAVGDYIEANIDDPDAMAEYQRLAVLLAGTLREEDRYDVLARIMDPLEAAKVQERAVVRTPGSLERARGRLGLCYAVAIAKGDPEIANAVARMARRTDPTPETRDALRAEAERAGVKPIGLEIFEG